MTEFVTQKTPEKILVILNEQVYLFLISNFHRVLKVLYFLLGDSPGASEFYMLHWIISFPSCGIADSRILITAAPENIYDTL